MCYEVQEFCLFGGWTNTWSYENVDGETLPSIFETKEEAESELNYFFDQMTEEFNNGNMEDIPDREDFRIVKIND